MQDQYQQPRNPINFHEMNPQFWACEQDGFQINQFYRCSEIPCSSSDSSIFPGLGKARSFQAEESEVVDELLQILVECMKKADVRKQEILLRKFFFEIEKDMPLERFLVERIKQSKINFLSERIPGRFQDRDRFSGAETISTREIDVSSSSEEETSEKLERFKVKTVQIGEVVKEEEAK